MKYLIYASCFLFISCLQNSKNLTIEELEDKSLSSGVRVDTIFGNVRFGINEDELLESLDIYSIESYFNFDVESFNFIDWNVNPRYFNDSLFVLSFINTQFGTYFENIIETYTIKYDQPDTVIRDRKNQKYYWFKGNLKIEVYLSNYDAFDLIGISYSDVSKKWLGIKNGFIDENNNFWTNEKYYKIYIEKKKSKLKGI